MKAPLFRLPKSFIDAAPEAVGLPSFDNGNLLNDRNNEDELEQGVYDGDYNERWLQQEIDNYFDRMENENY